MKAKIKANGEIVNIIKEDVDFVCADNGYIYKFDDIEILSHSNVENNAWSEEDDTFLRAIVRDIENVLFSMFVAPALFIYFIIITIKNIDL